MEGTRSRFIVTLAVVLLFSMNFLAMSIVAQREGNLEIVVGSTSKEVAPGEDAVFHWTAYNNDTFTSYDLSVTGSMMGEGHTEFSESSFYLEPGESHSITQTIGTSSDDENNTDYSCTVTWNVIWNQGPTSGTGTPMQWRLSVTVINNTNPDENGDEENGNDDDNSSTPGFEPIFLIVAILITLIIMRKKSLP